MRFFFTLFLLLFCAGLLFAQSIEKKLLRVEAAFTQGDVKKSLSINKGVIKKFKKNPDTTNVNFYRAHLNNAILNESLNKYPEMNANYSAGLAALNKLSSINEGEYVKGVKLLSDFFFQNGDYYLADSTIKKGLSQLDKADSSFGSLKYNYKLAQLKIYLKTGYYNEAYLIEQQIFGNVANLLRSTTKSKGVRSNPKDSVYSKKAIIKIKSDYASLLNLKAEILLNKGSYKELESEIKKNEVWMRTNIGRRNLNYRDHLFVKAKYAESKRDWLGALKLYEQVNHYTKYKPVEKTGLLVQEKLVLLNHQIKRSSEGEKHNKKLEKAVKRYFGTKSPIMARYNFLDVNKHFLDFKYNKADKRLFKLFNTNNYIKQNKLLRAALLDMKVKLLLKSCKFEEAEDSMQVVLALKSKMYGVNSPEFHKEKLKLADFYSNFTNKFSIAKDIQENSFLTVVAPQLSAQNIGYIAYMEQLASTYDNMEKYDMAIKYLNDASAYLKSYYGKNNIEYAVSLEKLASVLVKKGVIGDAGTLIKEAVTIFKSVSGDGYELNKSAAYLAMARLYTLLGSYSEAEDALQKAGKYSRRAKKSESQSNIKSFDEMAALMMKQGRFNEAERLLKNNIEKKQKQLGESNRELIPSLNLLGKLYLTSGNYAGAEKNIQKSLILTEKNFTDSSVRYTESLKLLEQLYRELGDFNKSEEVSRKTLQIQRKQLGNNHIEVSLSLSQLALIILHNKQEAKKAEEMMLEAIRITKFNFGDQHPQYAEQLKELAIICIHNEEYTLADSLVVEAEKVWKLKHSKPDLFLAELALLKGNIFYKRANYLQAQEKYVEAKKFYKAAFDVRHPGYVKASGKLARAYYMLNDYKNALKELDESTSKYLIFIKKYFPSLSFSEKSKYWHSIKDDFELYYTLATQKTILKPEVSAKMYNNVMATKALLLGSSIKVKERILNSKDENLIAKFDLWTEKKQYLLQVAAMDKDQQSANKVNIGRLEKEINQLEKDLSEGSEMFSKNYDNDEANWKKVKKSLKENEFAIEILRFRHFDRTFTDSVIYAAMVLSAKSEKGPETIIFPNGNRMENALIRYYRNVIINKVDEDEFSYDAFWQPIKKFIPDGSIVYVSNEGVYNELNLESLINKEGRYAIDKNSIAIVSNTKDLINKNTIKVNGNKKAVFFGNPTFYASANTNKLIPQLPGTEAEVSESQIVFNDRGWNTSKYIESWADEDSIKQLVNPKILHIATHGYFREDVLAEEVDEATENGIAENPLLNSGVVMYKGGDLLKTDNILRINSEKGILTAYEAMDMNLDNTDLVVLSACETGRGVVNIGEGVYGLQRAFLVAGANSVIMSLFKVDDAITKELMTNFYKLWLTSGDKRQALTEAKLLIKSKYKYPIYWGSFVLIGANN